MKMKSAFLLIIIFIGITALSSCKPLPIGYDTYFNSFTSVSTYSKIEKTLDLAAHEGFEGNTNDIYISGYDEEADVYLITENIQIGSEVKTALIGFCSESEVLIEPRYIHVLDISGDYAIAARYVAEGGIEQSRLKIGVVKFRGQNKGAEYGFSYSYMAAIVQYTFLDGQYLAMLGNKYTADKYQKDSKGNEYLATSYNFATVYDYTSSDGRGLLYIGEVANVANTTRFQLKDGHLVSSNNNIFRFHNLNEIDSNSFFKVKHTYTPFDKASTGFSDTNIECEGYYIGNNWFVLTAIHSSSTLYDSYEIIKSDSSKKNVYMTVKSVRYNAGTGKAFDTDRVVLVANKYSDSHIRELSNAVNSQQEFYEDSRGIKGFYVPPAVPTSASIKDGYSIIYYYFYYYGTDGVRNWSTTFNIYDQNANRINLKDLFMPLVFVDGVGLQNGDPNFNIPVRDATYYTYEGTIKPLQDLTDTMGFDTSVFHNGMVISYNFDTNTATSSMGAYDRDGNLAIPYRYYELTPFFGDYSTGSIVSGTGENVIREFYRVSKTGAEVLLDDVYALKNGVYITTNEDDKNTKYGLKANDGTELLPIEYDTVSVIDSLLIDGKYIRTVVTAVKDGKGIIFKLG